MKTQLRHLCALAAVVWLGGSALSAQTTGRIQGRVSDTNGAALAGVTITATSSNLQGSKVVATDEQGEFRLLSLPPGTYQLRAELDGFNTVEQPGVQVGIDRTVSLDLQLDTAFAGEITVSGLAPVVDVSSAEAGMNVTAETFERVPLARDFYQVAQLAPGVGNQLENVNVNDLANPQDDTGALGPTVSGSTGAENGYIIDGLNTTGIERGTTAKTLNFEFIEEVEVKTGGLPAEYGRMSGGVINAITKSGGNEFSGNAFGYFTGGGLQSENSTGGELPDDTTTLIENDGENDIGLGIGGALIKDSLWYFAAYNRLDRTDKTTVLLDLGVPGSPLPGSEIEAETKGDIYSGKLTWRIGANHNLSGSIIGDPSERNGNVFAIAGPASTWDGKIEQGADDYVFRYDGVYGGSWVIEALVGRHQEEFFTSGAGKGTPLIIDNTGDVQVTDGGFGSHADQEFTRDHLKLDLSKFVGSHELKFGVDQEDLSASIANWNGGGGQRIYRFLLPDGSTVLRHRYFVDDRAPGFNRADPATWTIKAPLVSEPQTRNQSAYAQDSWRVTSNLTVNAGLRWEQQELEDRDGVVTASLEDEWAPRLGVIWDATGNGRSKLYANIGRFYETVPMDMNIRAFGGELQAFSYNFSEDAGDYQPDPLFNTTFGGFRNSLRGGATPVDPDLSGQYIDEVMVGYEYEVMPNLAVGVQGSYRELGNTIEDFLIIDQGNYFIANPGQGLGRDMTFFDYSTVKAPEGRREYQAIEVNLRKRYSDNWQLFASYVWSKLEGNYDGVFQVSTGQLDPNINSAYDYADFLVNADGYLSNDRRHQVKVIGSYMVSTGVLANLNFGASLWWKSGLPLNAYGFSAGYNNNEYFLAERGSVGRGPSSYEADLHVSYPFQLGERFRLSLMIDVFNALDRQSKVLLDERYNRTVDGICEGYASHCNGDGGLSVNPGTLNPSGNIGNPRDTSPNPNYLRTGVGFTQPRSIRMGLRLAF